MVEALNENLPSISVIIPTYNSERTLTQCLESIGNQEYPRNKVEIIVVDGGSKDKTLEIARKYKVEKIFHNSLRTGEAGKARGVEAAKNDIVALVDSDNILPSQNWIKTMIEPLKEPNIVGCEPLYYSHRLRDPLITRYCALLGMNDPLILYIGNYDRYNHVTGKWTDMPVKTVDRGNYLHVLLDEQNIPSVGANGFMVRSEVLKKLNYQPYLFDIDIVYQLVTNGLNQFAKVKIGIVHLFADDVGTFVRKTERRIRDYVFYERRRMRMYPWFQLARTRYRSRILKFVLCTLLMFPLAYDSMKGYKRIPDKAWLFHLLGCWITLLVYSIGLLYKLI